jgi:dGTPase
LSSCDPQNFAFPPRRAPYAADPAKSRGRRVPEKASPTRTEFQRDRDRVLHSAAFRRLAHKTQVFVPHEGDHYRTRLTHSIEVGQIARALARALGLDDDLAEALALAHDLGHTPFGHTGEEVLDAMMRPYGGFDHNAQALRIVTKLEHRYATFDGLNLTWETLEGLVKHNGPMLTRDGHPIARYAERGLPIALLEYDAENGLALDTFASAEAQAAAIADDIAYNAHDTDDGLRAELFDFSETAEVDFLRDLGNELRELYPALDQQQRIHELIRRVITRLIEDVIAESRRRLAKTGVSSADDVRALRHAVVGFSDTMERVDKQMKSFLFQHMYRHPHITRIRVLAADVVADLYRAFFEKPEHMPDEWGQAATRIPRSAEGRRARLVCDYIAGMTDRYALAEHTRLFDVTPDLR